MLTLIYAFDSVVRSFEFVNCLRVSKQFLECADQQLTQKFIAETGLKPSMKLSLTMSANNIEQFIYGTYHLYSDSLPKRKLMVSLYVNHNWNPVTILWKSKQLGRDYKLHDENIDCNDIEFWFEKLDTDLYRKQLGMKTNYNKLKSGNFNFELVIETIEVSSTISSYLTEDALKRADEIANEVTAFVDSYNEASEKGKRKKGVVHCIRPNYKGNGLLAFYIDFGSTGEAFLKKLLQFLSDLKVFKKVVIDSPNLDDLMLTG